MKGNHSLPDREGGGRVFLIVTSLSVLIDIQTFILDAGRNAEPVEFLDTIEEEDTAGSCPEVNNQDTEALSAKEAPAVTVERTVRGGEQTRHECAENTADAVYRACTHGIVDVEHVVNELNGEDQDCTTDKTDDDSTHRRNQVATGCDTHKTCQHAVQRQ